LIRSAIACAALLVVTADLDVMDVYLHPYLQTYLPFVLAVPFATLAFFLASTLRATNRTLGSVIVSTYSINVMIIAAATAVVTLTSADELMVLSWAFFVGSLLAALIGVLLTRYVFKGSNDSSQLKLTSAEWREIYTSTGENGLTGLALAGLQWGPACALAVLGTLVEVAEFGVVVRTAQVIDFLIPAVIFVPHSARFQSRLCRAMRTARGKLAVDLSVSLATTTTCVLAVAILTPWFVSWYGADYSGLGLLFVLLFITQWVNGAARPAIRRLAADWDLHRIRRILFTSMAVAILLSVFGIDSYGTVAAAVAVLAGAVLLNGQAIESAFRRAAPRD
jgi:O-antigen/teichoic acid export membrane protein